MKNLKLPAIILLAYLSACKTPPFDHAYRITIQNNTTATVEYLASYSFPDTTIPNHAEQIGGIKAHDYTLLDNKEDWSKVIGNIPGHKLSLFFFSPDTISKYGWDTVRASNKILSRKDFTIQEIQAAYYKVTFP